MWHRYEHALRDDRHRISEISMTCNEFPLSFKYQCHPPLLPSSSPSWRHRRHQISDEKPETLLCVLGTSRALGTWTPAPQTARRDRLARICRTLLVLVCPQRHEIWLGVFHKGIKDAALWARCMGWKWSKYARWRGSRSAVFRTVCVKI